MLSEWSPPTQSPTPYLESLNGALTVLWESSRKNLSRLVRDSQMKNSQASVLLYEFQSIRASKAAFFIESGTEVPLKLVALWLEDEITGEGKIKSEERKGSSCPSKAALLLLSCRNELMMAFPDWIAYESIPIALCLQREWTPGNFLI